MIAAIFVVFLFTIIILMLTSAMYLVKIIFDTNDESNNLSDSLAMDSLAGVSPEQPPTTSKLSATTIDKIQKTNNGTNGELLKTSKQLFDDFDQRDVKLGGTGLHWCKSKKSFEKLIKLGLPLDSVNDRNETPLHVSVRRKRLSILIGLLCYGAEVNCKNDNGETPLILACKLNDIFACQLLLVFDADVDLTDNGGFSARHYASNISNRFGKQKTSPLPVVSDIILAMLHAMGAKRCSPKVLLNNPNSVIEKQGHVNLESEKANVVDHGGVKNDINVEKENCFDGCSYNGSFDGNSHNRWPDFRLESFNKRHMFDFIIEEELKSKKKKDEMDNNSNPNVKSKPSRILCIDGGGMRGVIVCQTMIELEKYLKKPIINYFDWVAGTSVGAFLACALCIGKNLKELRKISFDVKDEIFSGNKPYNSNFLERVLKRTLGSTTRMLDVKDKKLAVSTVIADREPCQLLFFRNYKSSKDLLESNGFSADTYNLMSGHSNLRDRSKQQLNSPQQDLSAIKIQTSSNNSTKATPTSVESDENNDDNNKKKPDLSNNGTPFNLDQLIGENEENPLMWQAVRASAAAPFFFKPYGPYLDGGIISNNPTLDMLTEFYNNELAKAFLRNRLSDNKNLENEIEQPSKLRLLLSLGTGRGKVISKQAMIDFTNLSTSLSTVFSPVELVRSIRGIRDLFKKLMQQSCNTDDHILDRAQAWCSSLGVPYFRINPPLTNISAIDDKRDEQIISALWQTKLYMRSMNKQIQQLAEVLEDDVYL